MRRRLTVCLSLAALFGAGLAPAQDPVEFSRLSTDQKQLAEQVRRLEKILITLEEREREEGATLRADLLKQAREKLINGAKERPLASVLEEVASDLADLRAGAALERQAELIRFLEDLLDFLLETERRDQVQDLMQAAREREAELRALANEQAELRQRTEALQQREAETGEVDEEARADLAREQAELNDRIREAAAKDENGAGSERAENAAAEGERAEAELDPDRETSESEAGEQGEREAGEQGEESSGEQGENPAGEQGEQSPSEQGEESPGEQGENGETPPGEQGETPAGEPGEQEPSEPGEQESGEQGEPSDPQEGEQSEASPSDPSERQPSEQSERQPGEQQEAGERQPGQQQSPQQPQDPQEQLERAEEFQRKAEEELERGADEAEAEADRLEGVDELETLINVLEKAEELLTRHERVLRDLSSFVAEMDGTTRVPRSARVDLRGWASEQRSIAEEANSLLFEIREAGADSFPFLLRGLVDDHGLLARRIGPPKYRADAQWVELGARIKRDWERLVNAIRTEAERLREKIEQPEQPPQSGDPSAEGEDPPQQPNPLVSVAAEVQLLKQLQQDLLERMQSLQSRRELLSSAGIELDEDDLAELEAVVQRQKRLRNLFESILERLQDTGETGEEI